MSRDPARGNRHLVRQRFRQAVFHDLCYPMVWRLTYSQNDCDRILQNRAFRLCKCIRNAESKTDAERCQLDSKKLLRADSWRLRLLSGMGPLDLFRFDSDPIRAVNEFSFSRVVDHPFKSVDPTKYHDEAVQVVLTFTRQTLQPHNPLQPATRAIRISTRRSTEWCQRRAKSVISIKGQRRWCQANCRIRIQPLWLPPRRDHAAPHLVVDGAGKDHLIWMSRISVENTGACIVCRCGEGASYTMPKRDLCHRGAFSPLNLVRPKCMPRRHYHWCCRKKCRRRYCCDRVDPQLDTEHNLYLCLWSERIRAQDAGGMSPFVRCGR